MSPTGDIGDESSVVRGFTSIDHELGFELTPQLTVNALKYFDGKGVAWKMGLETTRNMNTFRGNVLSIDMIDSLKRSRS